MTFAGAPRDHHVYEHAHESPQVMYLPLVVLAVFALGVGWRSGVIGVADLLEQARPAGLLATRWPAACLIGWLHHPSEHLQPRCRIHARPTIVALLPRPLAGFLLATVVYRLAAVESRRKCGSQFCVHLSCCCGTNGISTSCTRPCSCGR